MDIFDEMKNTIFGNMWNYLIKFYDLFLSKDLCFFLKKKSLYLNEIKTRIYN